MSGNNDTKRAFSGTWMSWRKPLLHILMDELANDSYFAKYSLFGISSFKLLAGCILPL